MHLEATNHLIILNNDAFHFIKITSNGEHFYISQTFVFKNYHKLLELYCMNSSKFNILKND